MIKINLLPFRAARKKENIRREVSIFLLTVLFLLVVSGYLHISLNQKLNDLEANETRLRLEANRIDEVLKDISLLKKDIKLLETRLEVIEGLESDKTGALQLLEEVAYAAPVERLWLSSLSESGGLLTLQGFAMDHKTVAYFMTSLSKAEHISDVDLKSTQFHNSPQLDKITKITTFVLTCKTNFSKPKPEPEQKGAKKGK